MQIGKTRNKNEWNCAETSSVEQNGEANWLLGDPKKRGSMKIHM